MRKQQSLADDAYVWQRRWGETLHRALNESAGSIRAWRVLAAEANGEADLTKIAVNRQVLRQIGKPVIAVIRIDGHGGARALNADLATRILALINDWKHDGVPVRGIEIDSDCATSGLLRYREFLPHLRTHMPRGMTLSLTALPSWVRSSEMPKLLAEVDESVLQVHSVMSSQHGLFDRAIAYRWAKEWSALSSVPFRLALPTYWSRVT